MSNYSKLDSYSISTHPIKGVCKSPAILGHVQNTFFPIIYLRKPKYISDNDFLEIVKSIRLSIPKDFKFHFM